MADNQVNQDLQLSNQDISNKSAESITVEFNEMSVDNKVECNADVSETTEDIEVTYLHDTFSQFISLPLTEDEDKLSKLLAERGIKANQGISRHTYISEKFPAIGRCYKSMTRTLESMITPENVHNVSNFQFLKNQLQELDSCSQNSLIAHALVTYLSTIDPHVFKRFGERIFSDVSHWCQQAVQIPKSSLYLHDDHINGLVCVTRLALLRKFPKYHEDGFRTMLSRPPLIYVGPATKTGVTNFLCNQLGLPLSCIREVDCLDSDNQLMDPSALRKLVDQDVANSFTPILLLAFAGTHMLGKIDDLNSIQKVCQERDMWMHCEGSSLSLLLQEQPPDSLRAATKCDSLTLNFTLWLGVPGIPFMTLYKEQSPDMAHLAGLYMPGTVFFKRCLPMWVLFQGLGINQLRTRCYAPLVLLKSMADQLKKIDHVKILNEYSEDCVTLIFRYEFQQIVPDGERSIAINDPYFDALNIWLVDIMRRDVSLILAHSIKVDAFGFCIRYSPLEHANSKGSSSEDVDNWVKHFSTQIQILNATVKQKLEFEDIVLAQDSLRLLKIESWAGLGAIQYVPKLYLDKYESLTDEEKQELNEINMKLVELLKDSDAAFSLGETENGEICARFGLITAETDFEELIGLVYTKGKQVEESLKFLETMADVIREGIVKAESDLVGEEQSRLANEGVIRQIPGVGSLVNWLSPPAKDPIKGRTFDLSSGLIESTQKTYDMKMQVQHDSSGSVTDFSRNIPESFKSVLKKSTSKEGKTNLDTQESVTDSVFENADK